MIGRVWPLERVCKHSSATYRVGTSHQPVAKCNLLATDAKTMYCSRKFIRLLLSLAGNQAALWGSGSQSSSRLENQSERAAGLLCDLQPETLTSPGPARLRKLCEVSLGGNILTFYCKHLLPMENIIYIIFVFPEW